jgi:hypothetical protein
MGCINSKREPEKEEKEEEIVEPICFQEPLEYIEPMEYKNKKSICEEIKSDINHKKKIIDIYYIEYRKQNDRRYKG